jgi:SpoIID/LytB domain protein
MSLSLPARRTAPRRTAARTQPAGRVLLRPLAAVLVGGLLLMAGGCRASSLPDVPLSSAGAAAPEPSPLPLPAAAEPLHWPAPTAAAMDSAAPVLWVALAAQLGPAPGVDAAAASPLSLAAASGALTLIDARGQRFMAPNLVLHWRREPLAEPFQLRRHVLGPYASFESAEQAALQWRAQGAAAVIAKPKDWEVWAPTSAPEPQGELPRLEERRETQRLVLELRRAAGTVTLQGPIAIQAPGGLLWKAGTYAGPFLLQADAYGRWSLVEQVPLERYLEGVVPHEIGAGSPPAALEAQAVLARTWAVRNRHRFAVDGYHLCADTQCQVYSDPRQAGAPVRRAIAVSRHQVLATGGQPIHAVYHASNGGVAAGFEEVWSGDPLPYLRPFLDGPAPFAARFPLPLAASALPALLQGGGLAWGGDHPVFRWQRQLSAAQLVAALGAGADRVGTPRRLVVLERGPSGRVLALAIEGSAGTRVLRLDAIRRTLRQLPSTLFTVTPSGADRWLVEGGGFGHGAGLSQAGAIDLARRGWSSRQILEHYYPGTALTPLGSLGGAP